MPRKRDKKELMLEVLKILSVDGRASSNEIARKLSIPKTTAYNLLNETIEKYGLKFVPEINIEELWKYEFMKLGRRASKSSVMEKTLESMPSIGFEEYMIFIKFLNKVPGEEFIKNAIESSYIPQFVARLHGEYDLVIYAVTRNYSELDKFAIMLSEKLGKYNFTFTANKIIRTFGFFPLRQEIFEQLNIFDNYKKLLSDLNKNGRRPFSEIVAKKDKEQSQITYIFDRLHKSGILERISYYETKPANVVSGLVQIKITNSSKFLKRSSMWLREMVNNGRRSHTEYTFICDILNPQGGFIFVNFKNSENIDIFIEKLSKLFPSVEIKYIPLTKIILGNLGVRNFDMLYSKQYQNLKNK